MTSVKALDASYKLFVAANGKEITSMGKVQFDAWVKK
jgi:hypothetical protein|tara:strand:+ start:499 stop:609 length:111 start_codon:yes stop_codon:yes gene_type:complete